jgi:Ca2+-binding EF-hand superfamily protein
MMVRFWLVVTVVLLTAGLACGAGPDIADLDLDSNGTLEMTEIDKAASDVFKKSDTNSDGVLDQSEYKAAGGDPSRFGEVDRDGNGRIDIDEFREAARKRFEQIDSNRDGRIDAQEWSRRQKPIVNPLLILFF